MASSNGYPAGLVLHQEETLSRIVKDLQPLLLSYGAKQEITKSRSLNLRSYQSEHPWKPISGSSNNNQFVELDSAVSSQVIIDLHDGSLGSMLFSSRIAEKCTRHDKILQFLTFGPAEGNGGELDLSFLSELMELKALTSNVCQVPLTSSLLVPSREIYAQKPLLDLVRDLAQKDGQVLFTGSGTEMTDLLSVVTEFYLTENSFKGRKQYSLVPHFNRLEVNEVERSVEFSAKLQATTVAPTKNPKKLKLKQSPKKKISKKLGHLERDLYRKNYFHACESLLSIMMIGKRCESKVTILSLKNVGLELPELLTHFSAGIAGTGLAVLFSIVYKVASGRGGASFCASRIFNTVFGLGLVWLSSAVKTLRDTIIEVGKSTPKLGLKEGKMITRVNKCVNEIYFRALAVMVVVVLRMA